jgi:hypothetical protein
VQHLRGDIDGSARQLEQRFRREGLQESALRFEPELEPCSLVLKIGDRCFAAGDIAPGSALASELDDLRQGQRQLGIRDRERAAEVLGFHPERRIRSQAGLDAMCFRGPDVEREGAQLRVVLQRELNGITQRDGIGRSGDRFVAPSSRCMQKEQGSEPRADSSDHFVPSMQRCPRPPRVWRAAANATGAPACRRSRNKNCGRLIRSGRETEAGGWDEHTSERASAISTGA